MYMDRETFEKELAMCRKLNQKNDGKCHWGECKTCGVIPLLHKLYEGKLLETEEQVSHAKHEAFEG